LAATPRTYTHAHTEISQPSSTITSLSFGLVRLQVQPDAVHARWNSI